MNDDKGSALRNDGSVFVLSLKSNKPESENVGRDKSFGKERLVVWYLSCDARRLLCKHSIFLRLQ